MLGQVLNMGLRFLMLPYLARSLNQTDYGTYGQVILVGEILLLIFSMGLSQVLFVQYANKDYSQKNTFKTTVALCSGIGLSGVVLIHLGEQWISQVMSNPALVGLLAIYSWQIVLQLLNTALNSTLIYFDKVKDFVRINVLTNLLRMASLFFAIHYLEKLEWIFYLFIAAAAIHTLLSFSRVPKSVMGGSFSSAIAKAQIAIGVPLGLTAVLSTVFKKVDGIMISNLLGTEDYAIYRMGAIEIPLLATLFYSVSTIVLPEVSKLIAHKEYSRVLSLKRKASSNSAVLIYPNLIFVLLFSSPLLGAYLGEAYSASIPVFIIYNLILFIRINDYRDILIASHSTKKIMLAVAASLVVNVILNLTLISLLGNIGAVIASVISFLLLAMMLQYLTNKQIGARFTDIFDFKKLGVILAISMSIGIITYLLWSLSGSLWTIPLLYFTFALCSYSLIHKMGHLDIALLLQPLQSMPSLVRLICGFFQRIRPF